MILPQIGSVGSTEIPTALAKRGPITYARAITEYRGQLVHGSKDDYACHIGVDPGTRNLGLARLTMDGFVAWQITLDDYPTYAWGLGAVRSLVDYLVDRKKQALEWTLGMCVIEEAAYVRFRSASVTGLESIRAMAALAFGDWGWTVETIKPPSGFKKIWGSAKKKSAAVWPDLGPDAATALGLAVLAAHWKEQN